jgi:multidrug resistance protein, MATE family
MMPTPKKQGYVELLKVAYPLMVSMGSFTVMQFVDRIFLARWSAVSLQAVVPAGILSFTFVCGFMALAGYSNMFVAQFSGAKDPQGCARATAQSVYVALLCWPLILLFIPVGQWLLRHSGHPPAVIEEEITYLTILLLGGVAPPLGAAISGFFTGISRTLTTMYAAIAANVVNLVLDYVFIFGAWGVPAMGIRGAAWASVISSLVAPAILFVLYFSRSVDATYQTRTHVAWEKPLLWRLVRFGTPSGLHLMLDVASFAIFVMLTGRMGAVALAASNIALSINTLAFLPMIGLSIATSTVVGQHQGAGEPEEAERAAWNAARLGALYMGTIGLTYIMFPQFYMSFFLDAAGTGLNMEAVFPIGRKLILIMALWGLVDSANLAFSGALKGAGDTRFVMWFSCLMAWGMLVPGQVLLVLVWEQGVVVSWAWTAFYIACMAVGFTMRFRGGRWKTIDMLGAERSLPPTRPGAEAMIAAD